MESVATRISKNQLLTEAEATVSHCMEVMSEVHMVNMECTAITADEQY